MGPSTIRFCVGSPEGGRSTVWRVWAHKQDVYIQSRMMGSQAKVSFHRTGLAQWSRTDEWVKRSGAGNADRHMVRWETPQPSAGRASLLFRIIVPASELQTPGIPRRVGKVLWVESPDTGHATLIECYLAPGPPQQIAGSSFPFALLATLPVEARGTFVILAHEEEVSPQNLRILDGARTEILALAKASGLDPLPSHRAVAFLVSPDGARGMIEIRLAQNAA